MCFKVWKIVWDDIILTVEIASNLFPQIFLIFCVYFQLEIIFLMLKIVWGRKHFILNYIVEIFSHQKEAFESYLWHCVFFTSDRILFNISYTYLLEGIHEALSIFFKIPKPLFLEGSDDDGVEDGEEFPHEFSIVMMFI